MNIEEQVFKSANEISERYKIRIVSHEKFSDRIRIYFHINDMITHDEDDFDKFNSELLELKNMLGLTYINWFDGSLEIIY